jgi:hypothetical protein
LRVIDLSRVAKVLSDLYKSRRELVATIHRRSLIVGRSRRNGELRLRYSPPKLRRERMATVGGFRPSALKREYEEAAIPAGVSHFHHPLQLASRRP